MTVKRSKFIKFLSGLLCLAMLLSCGITAMAAGDETPAPEGNSPAVDSNSSAYVNYPEYFANNDFVGASRVEGDLIASQNEIFVFRNRSIDALNNVTDKYEVFNTNIGKVVLTLENQYKKNSTIPANQYSFNAIIVNDMAIAVSITKTEYTMLTREEKENYKLPETAGDMLDVIKDYVYEESYEVYDVYGNKLASFDYIPSVNSTINYSSGKRVLEVSENTYVFDDEAKLVYSYNNITGLPLADCDVVTDNYYYFLGEGYTASEEIALVVVDKEGKVVFETSVSYYSEVFVLQNGNIFVQEMSEIPEGYVGGVLYDGYYCNLKSYIIDIATGTSTYLPDFGYVVEDIVNELTVGKKTYSEVATAKAINTAMVYEIKDGVVSENEKLVVFDNNMKLLVSLDSLYPLQDTIFDASLLPDGYVYVEMRNVIVDPLGSGDADVLYVGAIISPAGEITGYVKPNMKIGNGFVAASDAIYDYDFNLLYEYNSSRNLAGVTNDAVILYTRSTRSEWDPNAWNEYTHEYGAYVETYYDEYYCVRYYEQHQYDEYGNHIGSELVFGENFSHTGKSLNLVKYDKDYFIIYNGETNKYTLYSAKANQLLVTANVMNVYVGENAAIVSTYIDGHSIAYTLRNNNTNGGDNK